MMTNLLFPHESLRPIQEELIQEITNCLEKGTSIIAHAPTGLGKTAAALAPALTYAIENNKTVFFLTSRHTQHQIALDTLKAIKEKHHKNFVVSDIIGKKHMCLQAGVQTLYASEFFEYCKNLREDGKCEFYTNTYVKNQQLSVRAKQVHNELVMIGTNATKDVTKACQDSPEQLCPYEMSQQVAKQAKVVIADYFYIFDPYISQKFLKKIDKTMEDVIVIVDEAHNVPDRIRDLMTVKLSTRVLSSAIKEAQKGKYHEAQHILTQIEQMLHDLSRTMQEEEMMISREAVMKKINEIHDYDQIEQDFTDIATEVREEKKRSWIGSVAEFLSQWEKDHHGFVRYIKKEQDNILLISRCLDPSVITSSTLKEAHSVIAMSGTLTPTSMYRDLLGFDPDATIEREYKSPFPEENKLSLIIPETSTKYSARSEEQFKRIAEIAAQVGNNVEGNIALFFPSYFLRDSVEKYFKTLYEKTVFNERPGMTTEEKHELIERFKGYKGTGAALLGAAAGSFGEGVDLPGDLLKAVIVVGLPLQKPDLETQELIRYYDDKFNRGWDYGYLYPAFNKTLQNAGRCIRSDTDKGIVIYLDERYAWNNYFRCFPRDSPIKVTKNYVQEIQNFF